jgi:hypothetical protein
MLKKLCGRQILRLQLYIGNLTEKGGFSATVGSSTFHPFRHPT